MTKVEELRGHIVDMADGVSFSEITCFLGLLDSYAAVSHAEGVAEGERDKGLQGSNFRKVANLLSEANAKLATAKAEGAEQMKAEIRKTGEFIKTDESMSGQEGDWASLDEHRGEIEGMSARCDLFITRAAVLAPTKEGEP